MLEPSADLQREIDDARWRKSPCALSSSPSVWPSTHSITMNGRPFSSPWS